MTVQQAMGEAAARAIVRGRSSGRCEIGILSVCRGAATEFSHRVRRARGGLWLPSNGLDSCSGCHGWVNGRPILAEAAGLDYLPPHALAWPAWCEPFGWHRGWWHPRDDGTWTECATLAAWWVPAPEYDEDQDSGDYDAAPWRWETPVTAGRQQQPRLVSERPDAWEEQQRAHASLCTGLGACAA